MSGVFLSLLGNPETRFTGLVGSLSPGLLKATERTIVDPDIRSTRYHPAMERIVVNPDICNGRPTIRGTRITVHTVLEFLGAGSAVEDLLAEYPSLTREDVQASLRYASKLMDNRFTPTHTA